MSTEKKVTRKLRAILSADVKGYSLLMSDDEAFTVKTLKKYRTAMFEQIEHHSGRVVDSPGDNLLAEFASAVDAVKSAVEIQKILKEKNKNLPKEQRLEFRIGVNIGDVIQDDDCLYGEGVNIAARIEGLADPGGVCISRNAYDHIRNKLDYGYKYLGPQKVKNISDPVRVYQVLMEPEDAGKVIGERKASDGISDSLYAHYEAITKAVVQGRVVFFIGEGATVCGRPHQMRWERGRSDTLPSSSELAEHLAQNFDYPPNAPRDLVRVSQYISIVSGSGPLYEELHSLFDADYQPTPLHHYIASVPAALREKGIPPRYPLIVTTNYDDALQRAFHNANEPFDLVSYVADGEERGKFIHFLPAGDFCVIERPNEYRGLSLDQRPVILKIHGVVDRDNAMWDSFLITEDHYINYLTRRNISNLLPVTLAAKLRKSHFLFLGYSICDWNLRVILHRIWGEQKFTYKSWAILEKLGQMEKNFWRSREVDAFEAPLEQYVTELMTRVKDFSLSRNHD